MERLPDLRFCFAHAGGSFIPTIGRVQHGFDCRPDLVAVDNAVPPRDYLGRFWVDSATHDPQLLRYILEVIGDEKVCLGTDSPLPAWRSGDRQVYSGEMGLPASTLEKYSTKTPLTGCMESRRAVGLLVRAYSVLSF